MGTFWVNIDRAIFSRFWDMGFKVSRAKMPPPCPIPSPRKREIAYKAEIRRPIVHSRFWSRSLRFGRQSSCVSYGDQRYSLECQLDSSESAWTCVRRCEFVSSRVAGHLTFPSCVSLRKRRAAWKDILRRAPTAKRSALECFFLIWCEELLSPKKAENDVVVFFRCPYRWVSQSWRWVVNIRICRERKPVPELPKASS